MMISYDDKSFYVVGFSSFRKSLKDLSCNCRIWLLENLESIGEARVKIRKSQTVIFIINWKALR